MIGSGTCRDPFLIMKYDASRGETCIVVLIETMFESFEERKLFILMLAVRYFGLAIGMEIFWPFKDLSLDDAMTTTRLQQCYVSMDGCNDLGKKIVSCHDKDLLEAIFENVDKVEESGDMGDGFCDKEINSEMNYTSDECVKCFIGGSRFDYNNE